MALSPVYVSRLTVANLPNRVTQLAYNGQAVWLVAVVPVLEGFLQVMVKLRRFVS